MICRWLMVAGALLVAVGAGVGAGAEEQQCVGGVGDSQMSLSSWRNASGHWLATLRLERSAVAGRPMKRFTVDVESSSWRCGATRKHALTLHIQGLSHPPDSDYVKLDGGGFYKVHEELTNWEDSKSACEKEDAHLLIINSKEEADAILELIKRYPKLYKWIHIGFHDKDREGHHVTIFGETLSEAGFTRWRSGDPSGSSENCGAISKEVELVDIGCVDHKAAFICEHIF